MRDLEDFITVRNNKKYRTYCSICNKDKGFLYKTASDKCHSCSIRARNTKHNFVPIDDRIYKNGIVLYKASCKVCRKDRQYVRKEDIDKNCLSCSKKIKEQNKIKDPNIKIRASLRKRIKASINSSLKRRFSSKNFAKSQDIIGYSIQELHVHLESKFLPGMAWENRCQWHIDHIIPDSWFNYSSPEDIDFKESWALSNLQPLWAKDNISKGNRFSG